MHETGLFELTVQPFQRWAPFDKLGPNPTELEIFLLEEPRVIDLCSLADWDIDLRHKVRVWQIGPSEVEGCRKLHSPQKLVV